MKTYINVILDKSGSMQSVLNDTIGGFNSWLDKQQKAEGKQQFTLTLFDTEIVTKGYEDISAVPHLTTKTYVPGGATALLDAIGKTVATVPAKAKKVLIVIITDGEENSSHEYKRADIKALIETKEKAGWTFAYIGSSPDGFAEAGLIGIVMRASYAPTGTGTQAAFAAMSTSTMAYAGAATADAANTAYKNTWTTTIADPGEQTKK